MIVEIKGEADAEDGDGEEVGDDVDRAAGEIYNYHKWHRVCLYIF